MTSSHFERHGDLFAAVQVRSAALPAHAVAPTPMSCMASCSSPCR